MQNERKIICNHSFQNHITWLHYLDIIIGNNVLCENQLKIDRMAIGFLCELLPWVDSEEVWKSYVEVSIPEFKKKKMIFFLCHGLFTWLI